MIFGKGQGNLFIISTAFQVTGCKIVPKNPSLSHFSMNVNASVAKFDLDKKLVMVCILRVALHVHVAYMEQF